MSRPWATSLCLINSLGYYNFNASGSKKQFSLEIISSCTLTFLIHFYHSLIHSHLETQCKQYFSCMHFCYKIMLSSHAAQMCSDAQLFWGSYRSCTGHTPFSAGISKGLTSPLTSESLSLQSSGLMTKKNYISPYIFAELCDMLFINYCTGIKISFLEYVAGK